MTELFLPAETETLSVPSISEVRTDMNKTLISERSELWIRMWSCPMRCLLDCFLKALPKVLWEFKEKCSFQFKALFHRESPVPQHRSEDSTVLRTNWVAELYAGVVHFTILTWELLKSSRYAPIMYPFIHFLISNMDLEPLIINGVLSLVLFS